MASSPTDSPPSSDSPSPPPASDFSPPLPLAPSQSFPPPNNTPSPPPPPPPSPTNNTSPRPPLSSKSPPSPPPPSSSKSPPSSLPPPPPNNNDGNKNQLNSPPPPPPQKSQNHAPSSPPPRLAPSHRSSSSAGGSSGASLPVIIGVALGAGLLLVIMTVLVLACSRRKKKKNDTTYYPPHAGKGDHEYHTNGSYQSNYDWNNKYQNGEHVVNLPPPPGAAHRGGWGAAPPPPPPPPALVSSEMSSSSFSGPHNPPLPPPHPTVALGFNQSTFTYEELATATQGFSQSNILGQGGFGYVYKGLLPNGKEIAVKSLKANGGQGDREFQAEVEIISRVHHRHLVSLVGYSIAGGKKLLVYEFVPNNNLEYHLHGKGNPPLDWVTRTKIAIGSAKGLAYLHEDCHPRIIHRDIKAANILLDYIFEAKVADFGLAKLNQDNHTHVSTRVMGTFGYLAPEYASSGKLSEKSDTFSFGVVLLELITGRQPVDTTGEYEDDDSLVDWARPLCLRALDNGEYDELVDPRLEHKYDKNELSRMVACAVVCIRHSARKRPKMSQIVRALEGDVSLDDLSEGVKPGKTGMLSSSSDYDAAATSYDEEMRKFRKEGVVEREGYIDSSELGGTSEYGIHPSSSSNGSSTDLGRRGSNTH